MRYKITYTDPQSGEKKVVEEDFKDSPPCGVVPGYNDVAHNGISAREWAEDLAYSLADKGAYTVEEVRA